MTNIENEMVDGMVGPTLDLALIGQALTVQHVRAPHAAPEWARWLDEIGFIVGEQVISNLARSAFLLALGRGQRRQ